MRQNLWRIAFVTTIATTVIVGDSTVVHAGKWFTAEVLNDSCSTDVVIKMPWAEANAQSLGSGDIVLARTPQFCNLVTQELHEGVCGTKWTAPIPYKDIKNGEGRFRWFCGTTAERSRCVKGTGRIISRLGNNGLFRTLCQKWDPTQ